MPVEDSRFNCFLLTTNSEGVVHNSSAIYYQSQSQNNNLGASITLPLDSLSTYKVRRTLV